MFDTQQKVQNELEQRRKELATHMPTNPVCFGWASFSQCDEDGIIRECLHRISKVQTLSHTFIEVGCGNGLENNTHQLLLDGFHGCWIDGEINHIDAIATELGGLEHRQLHIKQTYLTLDNIDELIETCVTKLKTSQIDFFSLDTDGNDLFFVERVIKTLTPKLICVEYNAKFPPPTTLKIAYNANHVWQTNDYFGASLQAWVDVLMSDYALVCCNMSGANAFFVHKSFLSHFETYELKKLYQPSRYWLTGHCGFKSSFYWLKQILDKIE